MLRRLFPHALKRNLSASLPGAATASSLAEAPLHPEQYCGVFTNRGWIYVKKTHVARGWTQSLLDAEFGKSLAGKQSLTLEEIQAVADKWSQDVNLDDKPKFVKKTTAETRREDDLRLYLKQQNPTPDNFSEITKVMKEVKATSKPVRNEITFTKAWNYYSTINYKKYTGLSPAETRRMVAESWKQLSVDEKDIWRNEYMELLNKGKDILRGEIVDREVKQRMVDRAKASKQRGKEKRMMAKLNMH